MQNGGGRGSVAVAADRRMGKFACRRTQIYAKVCRLALLYRRKKKKRKKIFLGVIPNTS